VYEDGGFRDVETAAHMLSATYFHAIGEGKAYFAGENESCDQEGCAEKATVTYRVMKEFSRDNPHEWNKYLSDRIVVRKFCARHSTRGDCGFDDADNNYEVIAGEKLAPNSEDVKPSAFGGVISARSGTRQIRRVAPNKALRSGLVRLVLGNPSLMTERRSRT